LEITIDEQGLGVFKALSSETRIEILRILSESPSNVSDIASQLYLSKAITSRHLADLEKAKIITQLNVPGQDSRVKTFAIAIDEIHVTFPHQLFLPYEKIETEITVGNYTRFDVKPTCGLADRDGIIGHVDDPRSFVDNKRSNATLLWFSEGFVEYTIPNTLGRYDTPEMLDISFEISSEFPTSNNNWPSDISFYINDVFLGTYTVPGNFSDVRGKLNPPWWKDGHSQYGLLKHLRVLKGDTGLDGDKFSDVTIADLNLKDSPFITLKFAVNSDAEHVGGLTIFGQDFGNHEQNIRTTLYYSREE
jgi:predicted transcriptional regulator